jgi:hypothetical protein
MLGIIFGPNPLPALERRLDRFDFFKNVRPAPFH